jgi:biopolymer transport protein ExbD
MLLRDIGQFRNRAGVSSFNLTPVIDIVFLLIIFFVLACRFIEAENFPVTVPDGCQFAQDETTPGEQVTTLTVMNRPQSVTFAVGPEEITPHDDAAIPALVERLAQLIDVRLGNLPPDNRVVTLRIDKDTPFAQAQYALAAVAQSTATNVRVAVLSSKSESNSGPAQE